MFQIIFFTWYMIAILPVLIFDDMNDMIADFLKRKNIYAHWDSWLSGLLLLTILYIVLYILGYR